MYQAKKVIGHLYICVLGLSMLSLFTILRLDFWIFIFHFITKIIHNKMLLMLLMNLLHQRIS